MSTHYAKYEKYQETGIEWLPVVPEGWGVKRFKYYAKICNGKDQKDVLIENGAYPIFGSGGEFGRSNRYLYNKPSVLLGRKGTIDRPIFVDQPFWTIDTMFYTQIANNVNPEYFYYSCLSIMFDKYQFGSAIPSMTQEDLSGIHFSATPLPEQKAIADFLNAKTGKIDALIAKLKKQTELLKEYRISLITNAVTRGLNPNVLMKETGIEWLPRVPVWWEAKKLTHAIKYSVGFTPDTGNPLYYGDGYDWANISDLGVKWLEKTENQITEKAVKYFKKKPAPKNSLLYSFKLTVGAVSFAANDMYTNEAIAAFQEGGLLSLGYFYYLAPLAIIQNASENIYGAKILNQESIGNAKIILPPLPEQKAIADFLDKKTGTVDTLMLKLKKQTELLKEYRVSLITSAVTGQIKVTDSKQQR